jgi:anti-sigma factor RsiW
MSSSEITCSELVETITNYLENRMSRSERAKFEAHLATCAGCRNYLAQMRRTIQTTGQLREENISPGAKTELLKVFRAWKQN